jgi:hypothetical protein|tara:strand:- start:17 stop:739 length:723 start_codon:yes stop_codon:yes gene_type:complete
MENKESKKYKYIFRDKKFKTKKECFKYFKNLMLSCEKNTLLSETTIIKNSDIEYLFNNYFDGADEDFFRRKFGDDFIGFEIGHDRKWGDMQLQVKRKSGEVYAFTYKIFSCFGSGHNSLENNYTYRVNQAFRHVADADRTEFKYSKWNPSPCEVCSEKITHNKSNIDHVPDFKDGVVVYLKEKGYNAVDDLIPFTQKDDLCDTRWTFKEEIYNSFLNFHKKYFKLRYLCIPCHKEKTYGN